MWTEQHLQLILDAIPVRLIYFDTNMNIKWANKMAVEWSGLDHVQLENCRCHEILFNKQHTPCRECPVEKAIKTGQPQTGEITCPDGRTWLVQGYPVRDDCGGTMGIAEVTTEITLRKQMEEALSWEVKVNSAIAELSGKFLSSVDIDDIPYIILERGKLLTDSAYGFVGYIDPRTGNLILPTLTRDIWNICEVSNKDIVFKKFGGLFGWVLENKKPLITNSPGKDPRSTGTPPGHIPIHRFISAPALMDGKLLGIVSMANSNRDYTERDLALIERLAGLYAIAIYRKRGEKALQKSNEKLELKVARRTDELNDVNKQLLLELEERKRTEENLRSARQLFLDIINFLPDPTFVVDHQKNVIAWNKAMEEMTGVKQGEINNKGIYSYSIPFYGSARPLLIDFIFSGAIEENQYMYDYIDKKGSTLFAETYSPQAYNGKGAYLWVSASPLYDNQGNLAGAIETMRDITERRRMETQLKYLATHDSLTNIPNRHSLEENLNRAVGKARRGEKSALLFIDLDNFKIVNDILGHSAGDEILITLVNILKNNLQEGDLLFRFGGDQFAVLLEGITSDGAGATAEKLRRVIDESELCLTMRQTCFSMTISIGIVMVDGTLDCQKLLAYADAALNKAKEGGRNRTAFLETDQDITLRLYETNKIAGLIKSALKENRFVLFFQPVVRFGDGKVTHHETLLRLRKKNGELIMPGRFIPVAERYGLMSRVDRWVVQSSLNALNEFDNLKLFINLSGTSLGDDTLLELIETTIKKSGLNPSRIGFEITETAAVKDMTKAEHWIRRIKSLGCSFALDDFGIGFSSFSYLRMLPVDYLKIDGTFIRNIDTDSTHLALVRAMNTIANALGKKTIAEFVENKNVLEMLKEVGIDYGQGYYLGKPSPLPLDL